jgi:hypothetical protein
MEMSGLPQVTTNLKKHEIKANSHMPCRVHAVPLPCRDALIHTCHTAPLPFSDSAVSFVKVRVVAGNIRTASPTVYWNCMSLITTFVELRVVAGRSRTRAGRPHAVFGRPLLIHTCHAMPCPCRAHAALCRGLEKSLIEEHGRGMALALHGCDMACVNQTRPHCVNQMGNTQPKYLAARHGRGMVCVN